VDKVALGQVFSEYCGFPCHSFHRLLHTHHHPSSGAGTIGQTVATIPSGLSLTSPQETKKKKENRPDYVCSGSVNLLDVMCGGVPAGTERSMAAISVEATFRSSSELGQGLACTSASRRCRWNPQAPVRTAQRDRERTAHACSSPLRCSDCVDISPQLHM
jgi:hypothetical protein